MRRLLTLCSAVGLLCGALGCHTCGCSDHGLGSGNGHVHGRCDCEEPSYGCHWEMYCHGGDHGAAPAAMPAAPPSAEPLKALPKEITPKDKEE